MARYFRSPPRVPTAAEIDACLQVTDAEEKARDHIIVALAAMTGLRVSELVALTWSQFITTSGSVCCVA